MAGRLSNKLPDYISHGTCVSAIYYQCKCKKCIELAIRFEKNVPKDKLDLDQNIYKVELPSHIKHGTLYAYNRYKCRCVWCRIIAADYRSQYNFYQTYCKDNPHYTNRENKNITR